MVEIGLCEVDELYKLFNGYNAFATNFYIYLCGRNDDKFNGSRYAEYWCNDSKVLNMYNDAYTAVTLYGQVDYFNIRRTDVGIRPVIRMDEQTAKNLFFYNDTERLNFSTITEDSNINVIVGQYPQDTVDPFTKEKLENLFSKKGSFGSSELKETGNKYPISLDDQENALIEYEYQGRCYVRIEPIKAKDTPIYDTSNGSIKNRLRPEWFETKPIIWKLVKMNNVCMLVASDVLTTGQMLNKENLKEGEPINLKDLDIYKFLDKCLAKAIFKGSLLEPYFKGDEPNLVKKEDDKEIDQEELIEKSLLSGVPIALIGDDVNWKNKLITKYDPNLEIVCLNNASYDSLAGINIYDSESERMIDVKPSWLKSLEGKCELEPERIHIVYFDEMDDTSEDVQTIVREIASKRTVRGKWQLPFNSRIVVSEKVCTNSSYIGNAMKIAIKPTAKSWLKNNNAKRYVPIKNMVPPKDIHPLIYEYIEYKEKNGEDLISRKANGDIPELNPKKWEMASRLMYATNNPRILENLLGKDGSEDFDKFCNSKKKAKDNEQITDTYER